jgi:hypothetical protein
MNPQASQTTLQAKSPARPDETRSFETGRVELVTVIVDISGMRDYAKH